MNELLVLEFAHSIFDDFALHAHELNNLVNVLRVKQLPRFRRFLLKL
jgi:hypothetical protein